MIGMVTGHRPDSLWGYDMSDPRYNKLKNHLKSILEEKQYDEIYTGMALGVDQLFAKAVIELNFSGYDIKLNAAIPFIGHGSNWPKESQEIYRNILKHCHNVKMVTERSYDKYLLQVRNEYMVDHSDVVIAVWNGSPGGTANCVHYAEKKGKDMIFIDPRQFEETI